MYQDHERKETMNASLIAAANEAMTATGMHTLQTANTDGIITVEGFWTDYEPYRIKQTFSLRHEGIWDVVTELVTPRDSVEESKVYSLVTSNLKQSPQLVAPIQVVQTEASKTITPRRFETMEDMLVWTELHFKITREETIAYFQGSLATN